MVIHKKERALADLKSGAPPGFFLFLGFKSDRSYVSKEYNFNKL
jgi:hypothetical protein